MRLWDGHRGAVSLTFDDGMECQLANAVPALDERGLRGTFFLVADSKEYPLGDLQRWKRVAEKHEIGSHTVLHGRPFQLSREELLMEVEVSKRMLEWHVGPAKSFCYPYTDAPQQMQDMVKHSYKQARGGRIARTDKFIVPGDGVNLFNVPCFHFGPETMRDLPDWIDEAISRTAWFTLMIHGVGQDGTWDNVDVPDFRFALDMIAKSGLWVPTFGDAAENLRNHAA